ncbi:MAG: rhomboid family intramembrane serine protease [Archangiaceae bacterium]|nr:rhomboid family intramembrane serine protease [Archangiaceae bacterium]
MRPEVQPATPPEPGLLAGLPLSGRPRATWFLIGMNVAVFVAMVVRGVSATEPRPEQLLDYGANFGGLMVVEHQWWRALTSMFVHIGALHLAVNMYSLWNVGSFVERLLGAPKFVVVYLLTGLAGSFAMVLWSPLGISAGASGAIFGLFGVLMGFTFRARGHLPPETLKSLRSGIFVTLGFNLLFALTTPFLGHAAHLGGMVTGVLAGVMVTDSALTRQVRRPSWSSLAIVLAATVGVAVLADVRTKSKKHLGWELAVQRASLASQSERWEDTVRFATQALEEREDPELFELRGLAYSRLGQYEPAISDYEWGPKTAQNRNNHAWALVRVGRDLDRALELADLALAEGPNAAVLGTRCWVQVARGEPEKGQRDCEEAVRLSKDDLMDEGMLRFIAGDFGGALKVWDEAAKDPANAFDLQPWLERARAKINP